MNTPDMQSFYNHPHVLHQEYDHLVVFSYDHSCTYDRAWDDITMNARGIIFDKTTGRVVSRPFAKFFNLNEMPQTSIPALPPGPFSITEKLDGSLGIQYPYKGTYRIATRGSFISDQALWATAWYDKNVHGTADPNVTCLYEIIYPQNKIVVDYGDFQGLVLLACIETATGIEIPYEQTCREGANLGVTVVDKVTGFLSIEELYDHCRSLPPTKEGFVVTFSNGLKIKMKGDEYCKIHRIISHMTPLAFWEAWDVSLRCVPKEYIKQVPEEFRELCDALETAVNQLHRKVADNVREMFASVKRQVPPDDRKSFAIFIKEHYPQYLSYLMSLYDGREDSLWEAIHKRVRPTGNVLPEQLRHYKGMERVERLRSDDG